MECLKRFLIIIGTSILLSYFALQKSEIPNGNIVKERMVFTTIHSSTSDGFINNRFSRTVVDLTDSNGDRFRFSSNGHAVRFIEENISKGDEIYLYWFSPCHEIIRHESTSCKEVLGVNDSNLDLASNEYMETRWRTFLFLSSILFFILLLWLVGCIVGYEEKDKL